MYIAFLRKKGVAIGEGTAFFGRVSIDYTRPYLIEIGKNCVLTDGVTLLTHGYESSVLRQICGELFCSSGKVLLEGNNFVGINSVILKGVRIGKNTIIGACSVVTHDIPSNCVAAGNPCNVIMKIDEYYEKRKALHAGEARAYALELYRRKKRIPTLKDFSWEEFPLFQKTGYSNSEPIYKSFEEFLLAAGIPITNHKEEN